MTQLCAALLGLGFVSWITQGGAALGPGLRCCGPFRANSQQLRFLKNHLLISSKLRVTASALAVVLSLMQGVGIHAQEVADEPIAAEQEAAESEPEQHIVALGDFNIKDLRPTRNETAKLQFTMHLALDPSVNEQTAGQLEHWVHRLRNQVIIAIRASDINDFLDADLDRFRSSIRRRANRAMKARLIADVLLTEFTFSID